MQHTVIDPDKPEIYKPVSQPLKAEKEEIMDTTNPNVNLYGMGNGDGNNMAALWPLLLLGGRGFGNGFDNGNWGRGGNMDCVTPAQLATALADSNNQSAHTVNLQTLGDIKASIPLAEGQVQLALAGQTASVLQGQAANALGAAQTAAANAAANALGQTTLASNQAAQTATIIKGQADIEASMLNQASQTKEAILTSTALLNQSVLQSKYDTALSINADGDKTRALIIAQNDAMLNRELAVAQSALLEARQIGRERDNNLTITQTVNQNNNQNQMQQQQQQQFQILANLAAQVGNLANDIQVVRNTQSNVNFGTQLASGQTANGTNVRA